MRRRPGTAAGAGLDDLSGRGRAALARSLRGRAGGLPPDAGDTTMSFDPVVRLADVTRVHGDGPQAVSALRGVSLDVAAGELVAVMGPSGSGKSTLLNLAGGLDLPTSGSVVIEGTPLVSLKAADLAGLRRRHVGYVFQDLNLIPSLTAAENVMLPRELDGIRAKQARREALEVARRGRSRRGRRPVPRRDLRWSAPAGRDRPRAGRGTAAASGRRAHRRAGHPHRRRHPPAPARPLRRGGGGVAGHPRAPLRRLGRPGGLPARRRDRRLHRRPPGERPMNERTDRLEPSSGERSGPQDGRTA